MAYFYTAAEIVAKIQAIDTDIATARTAQKYNYDQGPVGQFGVEKGSIKAMIQEREMWEALLKKHYPDSYAPDNAPTFYEIGHTDG